MMLLQGEGIVFMGYSTLVNVWGADHNVSKRFVKDSLIILKKIADHWSPFCLIRMTE